MLFDELLDVFDELALLVEVVLEVLEAFGEPEEPDAVDDGVVGVKLLLPMPKPSAAASLPLLSTVTVSLLSLAVITNLPLLLIEAVTNAGPELMALIRSATVSLPVDVYLVILVPSSMLNVPPGKIPRLESVVLVVSGTVPVPVAGVGDEAEEADVDDDEDALELLDEDEVPNACWTSAVIWLLTRLSAVWLAILARPFPRLVSASCMTVMSESSADCA